MFNVFGLAPLGRLKIAYSSTGEQIKTGNNKSNIRTKANKNKLS